MRQSQLFTKITKEIPKDESSANARILIQSGFIDKVAAGVYTFLPMGLRVHSKICQIIREEMDAIGGQEILMPSLTPKDNWRITGRWDNFDALFKLAGNDKKEYALGATHEEVITPLAKKFIFSYKELPVFIYQIQTKFRNELRAKAGLIRGREFSMKDLYSFHESKEDLKEYYKLVQKTYFKIFERLELLDITYLTFASGGAFSKYSHEFQTLAEAGEDVIHICDKCDIAINEEIIKEQKNCPNCGNKKLKQAKAVEVGNIFKLRTKFSKPFGFQFTDKRGQQQDVYMGCYGMGPSRIMGTVAEIFRDDNGVIWPEEIAPFKAHIIPVTGKISAPVVEAGEKMYSNLVKNKVEVLYDDRLNYSPGEKFAEADMIGCPYRLVISEKTLKKNCVEVKRRNSEKIELVSLDKIVEFLNS
ncbi:MAG: aminoacyl--tRNA ligase-related protein [Patescibacteria group bacterium]|nr:aminoacyl--tRNA ligase-related protein [Patescibacteria group bacterium]